MRREWTIWLGFMAVVLVAVVFILSRDDNDPSQLATGTSVPTTTIARSNTTVRTVPPTTLTPPPTIASPSTTGVPATTAATTPRVTTPTTEETVPVTTPPTAPPTVPQTVPPTTPTTQPLGVQFGPGTYRVNIDLPPGTFHTDGIGSACTWARLSSVTDGPQGNIIASGDTGGAPATVTVQPTDAAFYTAGCAVWYSV